MAESETSLRVESLDLIKRYRAVCGLCGYAGKLYEQRWPAAMAMKQHGGGAHHRRAERLAYVRPVPKKGG